MSLQYHPKYQHIFLSSLAVGSWYIPAVHVYGLIINSNNTQLPLDGENEFA